LESKLQLEVILESQTCPIKVETGQETYQTFVMGYVYFSK